MTRALHRIFIDHPSSVDETYVEHLRFAGGFAGKLIVAGLAASIHALIPCLFEKTASRLIKEMHARIEGRG